MQTSVVLLYILIFFVALSMDFFRGKYIKAVNENNAVKAAFLSSTIVLLSFFIAINYICHKLLIIPVVVGGFIGTYSSVSNNKKQQLNNEDIKQK